MTTLNLMTTIKRTLIASMGVGLVITSSLLFMKSTSPPAEDTHHSRSVAGTGGETTVPAVQTTTTDSANMASVAVIVLNSAKDLPLAMNASGHTIEIPGPSAWPADSAEKGRFVAGIIDTADVLKANGLPPTAAYSFTVNGTPLTVANTFRVTGNHLAGTTPTAGDGYTVEYHSLPGEGGIWRSLRFKNIVLSYGQIPSLTDFLASAPTPSATDTASMQTNDSGTSALSYRNPQEMVADMKQGEDESQKYRDAMNSPDPALRAQAVQDLVVYGVALPGDTSHPGIKSYIEKALADNDASVRQAGLRALELWGGNVPLETLSKIVLNDQNPDVRVRALNVLVDRYSDRSVPTLQQASHDPDARVAKTAGEFLQGYSPQ